MKNITKKKIIGAVIGTAAAGVIAFAGFMGNEIFGNPISERIVQKSAVVYLEENYPDLNYEIIRNGYDFKSMNYYVVVQSLDSEDTRFWLSCSKDGKHITDDYDWRPKINAEGRFASAASNDIEPKLINEFGEKAEVWVHVETDNAVESGVISLDQPVDLDNFPFEIDVNLKVFSEDGQVDEEQIAETVKRIDKVVDGKYTVCEYSIGIWNSEGSEYIDSVYISTEEAKAMY